MDGTLLVWGEQGLGDQILHASMVGELTQRAAKVVLEVEPRLAPLFARSFPDVQVVALAPELHPGPVDVHVPLGGLGRYLRPSAGRIPGARAAISSPIATAPNACAPASRAMAARSSACPGAVLRR